MSHQAVISGKVHLITPIECVGEKSYEKCTVVVVDEDEKSTQFVPIEFFGKGAGQTKGVQRGDFVEVHYSLRGREYNGKWYSNVSGFKITIISRAREERQPSTISRAHDVDDDPAEEEVPF